MKIFSKIYDKVIRLSQHRHASHYLAGVSFAEATFFPIAPDVMLVPMTLAEPSRAWRLAFITTIASIFGGISGYLLGYFAYEPIVQPFIEWGGYQQLYDQVVNWFHVWGFWIMIVASVTPIPFKVFTLAAGAVSMTIVPFFLAMIVGRGIRFYGVTAAVKWGGVKIEPLIVKYVDRIGWVTIVLLLIAIAYWQFTS